MNIMTELGKMDKEGKTRALVNNGSIVDMLNELTLTYGGTPSEGGSIVQAINNFREAVADELASSGEGSPDTPVTPARTVSLMPEIVPGVIFIDYDGTVVDYISPEDMLEATSLPANPSHEGLTAQGWNWDLADIKRYLTDYPGTTMTVGQMYITDDGKSRIHLNVHDRLTVPLAFSQTIDNGVTVDWGDGSQTETFASDDQFGNVEATHTYEEEGEYVITFSVADGCALSFGRVERFDGYNVLNEDANPWSERFAVFTDFLTQVNIGEGVENIGDYSFQGMLDLKYVTIPEGVDIGMYSFMNCVNLVSATLPKGISSVPASTLYYCTHLATLSIPILSENSNIGEYAVSGTILRTVNIPYGVVQIDEGAFEFDMMLSSLTIPDGVYIGERVFNENTMLENLILGENVDYIGEGAFSNSGIKQLSLPSAINIETISDYAFYGCQFLKTLTLRAGTSFVGQQAFVRCWSLKHLVIPSSMLEIDYEAFSQCMSLQTLTVWAETPPVLNGIDVFYGIPDDCIIYIPYGTLSAYENDTNWTYFSGQFVEMAEGAEPDEEDPRESI